MQTITATRAIKLSQLMEELVSLVATFRRATGDTADDDMGSVSGVRGRVEVAFANDIDPALVQAVIDAHVPAAPPTPRNYKAELALIPGVPPALVAWLNDVLRLS